MVVPPPDQATEANENVNTNAKPKKRMRTKKKASLIMYDKDQPNELSQEAYMYLQALHNINCDASHLRSDVIRDTGRWTVTVYEWWHSRTQSLSYSGPSFESYRDALLFCCKRNSSSIALGEWKAYAKKNPNPVEPFDVVSMIELTTTELERYLLEIQKITDSKPQGALYLCNNAEGSGTIPSTMLGSYLVG